MASIVWSVRARDDLRSLSDFIAQDSPTYAAATVERVLQSIERLREYPRIGRVVPEYDDESIREIIVGSYRVVYRLRRQRVSVVAVVHGSRNLLRQIRRRRWDFG